MKGTETNEFRGKQLEYASAMTFKAELMPF